ncbi:MAG TPA: hypothetical protein VF258_01670 [Luteolibacter sp.]
MNLESAVALRIPEVTCYKLLVISKLVYFWMNLSMHPTGERRSAESSPEESILSFFPREELEISWCGIVAAVCNRYALSRENQPQTRERDNLWIDGAWRMQSAATARVRTPLHVPFIPHSCAARVQQLITYNP